MMKVDTEYFMMANVFLVGTSILYIVFMPEERAQLYTTYALFFGEPLAILLSILIGIIEGSK